jgi:hypothetical protein
VKALPWYGTVRKKLDDPAFAGFFLQYNCTSSAACSKSTNDHCDALNKTLCVTPFDPTGLPTQDYRSSSPVLTNALIVAFASCSNFYHDLE